MGNSNRHDRCAEHRHTTIVVFSCAVPRVVVGVNNAGTVHARLDRSRTCRTKCRSPTALTGRFSVSTVGGAGCGTFNTKEDVELASLRKGCGPCGREHSHVTCTSLPGEAHAKFEAPGRCAWAPRDEDGASPGATLPALKLVIRGYLLV